MKKTLFFLSILAAVGTLTACKQNTTQNETTTYVTVPSKPKAITVADVTVSGNKNDHAFVDLGLPSGLKWATCNIGANKPEDYGSYFAWGETDVNEEAKKTFVWSTYKYCKGTSSSLTKYNRDSNFGIVDNKTTLDLTDDAAYVNWGDGWRMPTQTEWNELLDNCDSRWATKNDVPGRLFKSRANGNTLFLPAAGYRGVTSNADDAGSHGYYWSSSLYEIGSRNALELSFNVDYAHAGGYYRRSYGRSVRAVCN